MATACHSSKLQHIRYPSFCWVFILIAPGNCSSCQYDDSMGEMQVWRRLLLPVPSLTDRGKMK